MKALEHCVNGWQDTADGTLESLYNDLQKLFQPMLLLTFIIELFFKNCKCPEKYAKWQENIYGSRFELL